MERNNEHPHLYKLVNNYHLVKFLGNGQFGQVYQALDTKSHGTLYAVKIVNKQKVNSKSALTQLFKQEVSCMKTLSAIKHNPYCVRLHDFLETTNNYYLVLEYCNQMDLEQHIKKKSYLVEDEALVFLKQLMEGFKIMHQNNIMHRDFKAANVFLHNNTAKIGDFGFAREVFDYARTVIGTPITLAPEVLNGKPYTNKADLWSLAVVFYHMLEGKVPFQAQNVTQLLNAQEKNNITFTKSVSEESKEFIRKSLVYDQHKRWSWNEAQQHPLLKKKDNVGNGIMMSQIENHNEAKVNLEPSQVNEPNAVSPEQALTLTEAFDQNTIVLRRFLKKYDFLCKSYCRFPQQPLINLIVMMRIRELLQILIQTLTEKRVISPQQLDLKYLPEYCESDYVKHTLQKTMTNLVISNEEIKTLVKNKKHALGELGRMAEEDNMKRFSEVSKAQVLGCIFNMGLKEQLEILDIMLMDQTCMEKEDYLKYIQEKAGYSTEMVQEQVNIKSNLLLDLK